MKLRWLGTAGLEITHDGHTYLIDPYLTRPNAAQLFLAPLRSDPRAVEGYLKSLPGEIAALIVGHTHFDHALDIPLIARHMQGMLVGSQSLDNLLCSHAHTGRVQIPRPGERLQLPGGALLEMLPSRHGRVLFGRVPALGEIDAQGPPRRRVGDYRLGDMCMPKLTLSGTSLVHAGSAGFIESALEGHTCDVLFLCVAGWQRSPGYPGRLLEILKPSLVVPFHYDDFTAPLRLDRRPRNLPRLDLTGFLQEVGRHAPSAHLRLLRPFEPLTL